MISIAIYALCACIAVLGWVYIMYPLAILMKSHLAPSVGTVPLPECVGGGTARALMPLPYVPRVAVIIPAYNEADILAQKVENTRALMWAARGLTIHVVTDGSTDGSPELDLGSAVVHHRSERRGKNAAVNRVAATIDAEIIVITDANTHLPPSTLYRLIQPLADPRVGCVSGAKRVLGGGEGLYWRYESWLKTLESDVCSAMGAPGELLAIRADLFTPPPANAVVEDFELSMGVVARGYRLAYAPEALCFEAPSPSAAADFERRARIAAGGLAAVWRLRTLADPRRGWTALSFWSHRVLRWGAAPAALVGAAPLSIGLAIATQDALVMVLATGQGLAIGLAALAHALGPRASHPVLTVPHFLYLTHLAVLAGTWRWLTASQPVVWRKVRTSTTS
jgi:cellulose synthase/poly-beta-1,6-N-acetylglucosamine synthase-like glycosyltransferase